MTDQEKIKLRYRWWQKNRCPHIYIRGIYGDEINARNGFRLECLGVVAYLMVPCRLQM